jgi:hypothetical protein
VRHKQLVVSVVHYFETLPSSLAPLLILDAYRHDRMFYKLWRGRRGNLTFLKRAPKSYGALTFHRATIPAGKVAHRIPEQKALIVRAGMDAHFKAAGPMLNAIHKPVKDCYDVQSEIMEAVKAAGGDPYRDAFQTWGNLTGVNDYGEYGDMFVGGLFRKPPHHYKAIYSAAAKMKGREHHDDKTLSEIELSEIMHELQQAVGRIVVRKNVDGTHPEAHVMLAAPANAGRLPLNDERLRQGFPDCAVVAWHPIGQSLKSGRGSGLKTNERQRLLDRITIGQWFRVGDFTEPLEGETEGLSDQKVRRYLSEKDQAFRRALKDRGLSLEQREVGRARAHEYRVVRLGRAGRLSRSCRKGTVQNVEKRHLPKAA